MSNLYLNILQLNNIMNILVSAFITKINNRNDRDTYKYIEYGKLLIDNNINSYKVIFIERETLNTYFNTTNKYYNFKYENKTFDYIIFQKNIIYVIFEKTDNYLYNYIDEIAQFNIHTDNPSKDTLEYMFVQCHKTEWIKIAISLVEIIKYDMLELNDNLQFIWVDFGIYHMFNNNIDLFNNSFTQLHEINNNKVRIASCIHPNNTYHSDIYKNVAWYFAGSVFGGVGVSLLKFAELMKAECINIIKERNHLMWEVNIWYLIYLKHPELFDPYNCNHNASIIANY